MPILRIVRIVEGTGVPGKGMAPLTEQRHFRLQHLVVMGPVGAVTIGTIFLHGGMLPKVGAAFVLVALETELIETGGLQVFRRPRTVRIMAGTTTHLALCERHMGGPTHLPLHIGMACIAGVLHFGRLKLGLRILWTVDGVTLGAGHICSRVGTAFPMRFGMALCTGFTNVGWSDFDGSEPGVRFVAPSVHVQ